MKSSVSGSNFKVCADAKHTNAKHANLQGKDLAIFRTRVCEQHRNGGCLDADRCAHSHCQTWQRRNPTDYNYSSKLCPDIEFVKKGKKMTLVRRCSRGRGCVFAHSKEEELYHPSMYKTKLCNTHPHCTRYFCPFAHSIEELRPPSRDNNCVRVGAQCGTFRPTIVRGMSQSPGSPMSASTAASTSALPSPTLGALEAAAHRHLNGHSEAENQEAKLGDLGYPVFEKLYSHSDSGSWRCLGSGVEQRQQLTRPIVSSNDDLDRLTCGDAQLWTEFLMDVLKGDGLTDEHPTMFEQCSMTRDSTYSSLIDASLVNQNSSHMSSFEQTNVNSSGRPRNFQHYDKSGHRADGSVRGNLMGGFQGATPEYPQRSRGDSFFLPSTNGYPWIGGDGVQNDLDNISRRRLSSGMTPFHLSRLNSRGCPLLRRATMHDIMKGWLEGQPIEHGAANGLRQCLLQHRHSEQSASFNSLEALEYDASRCGSGSGQLAHTGFSRQWGTDPSESSVSNNPVSENDVVLLNALGLLTDALPDCCDEPGNDYSNDLIQHQQDSSERCTISMIAKMLQQISESNCGCSTQQSGQEVTNGAVHHLYSAQTGEPCKVESVTDASAGAESDLATVKAG